MFSMFLVFYFVGENKVIIFCGKIVKENSIFIYELQKEINGDWIFIFKVNDFLMYRVNEDIIFDNFFIIWFSGICGFRCFVMFKVIVRLDMCMMDYYVFFNVCCGII